MDNEVELCQKYLNKARSSDNRGIEFTLSFADYKRLKARKRCQYTGLPLTENSLTLERIDHELGYTKSNTTVCHTILNTIKGTIENPNNPVEIIHLKRMVKYLSKVT